MLQVCEGNTRNATGEDFCCYVRNSREESGEKVLNVSEINVFKVVNDFLCNKNCASTCGDC